MDEGFLAPGRGGGFLPIGGGGPLDESVDTDDKGRGALLLAVFRRFDMDGLNEGALGNTERSGKFGAAPTGGRGAEEGFGDDERSGSDRYEAPWFAIYI
jgi:hypothetical protein